MLFALGVAIVAVGVLIAVFSPHAGLLFFWAWFIVRPQEIVRGLGGGVPLERILVLALIASLIVHHRLLKAEPFFFGRITWALAAFVAVNYLSVFTAVWRSGALLVANELGKTLVFYFCLINLITNSRALGRFLWVYVLGIGWLAASSLWAFGAHPYYAQGIQRATSLGVVSEVTWGDPNVTAANLALSIPVLYALLKGTRSFLGRIILVGLLALYLICIVLTGSRNGGLLVVVVFLVMALQSAKRVVLIPALFASFILAWFLIPAEYQERYKTLLNIRETVSGQKITSSEGESAYGRVVGFEVAMQMFVDRPILGVGAGDFAAAWWAKDLPYSYHGYKGWHQPHNLPGQLLAELGLLGAATFGYFVFTLLRKNRAARHQLAALRSPPPLLMALGKAIVVVVIALFVGGLSGHNLYRYNWYLAGGLVALLCRMTEQEKAVAESSSTDSLEIARRRQTVEEIDSIRSTPDN